ncbi:MAG TPA: hypothetical protein VEN79_18110, partial [Terriglobia bacterium]|nr:hypothetical protein [Terriglobia bacterium]
MPTGSQTYLGEPHLDTPDTTRRDFLGTTARTSAAFIVGCLFNGEIAAFDATKETRWVPLSA